MVNHDAPHQLSGRCRSWVTSCHVDGGFVIQAARLLDAANSNTAGGFFTTRPEAIKKIAQSWRVSGALSALTHEPAQTTKAGKTKQKPNLKQEKTYAN